MSESKGPRMKGEEQALILEWRDGCPPHPWDKEWFIALTMYGEKVVLRALPEEYGFDYTTADGTYMKKEKVKKWMQFPDSAFIAPANPAEKVVFQYDGIWQGNHFSEPYVDMEIWLQATHEDKISSIQPIGIKKGHRYKITITEEG